MLSMDRSFWTVVEQVLVVAWIAEREKYPRVIQELPLKSEDVLGTHFDVDVPARTRDVITAPNAVVLLEKVIGQREELLEMLPVFHRSGGELNATWVLAKFPEPITRVPSRLLTRLKDTAISTGIDPRIVESSKTNQRGFHDAILLQPG